MKRWMEGGKGAAVGVRVQQDAAQWVMRVPRDSLAALSSSRVSSANYNRGAGDEPSSGQPKQSQEQVLVWDDKGSCPSLPQQPLEEERARPWRVWALIPGSKLGDQGKVNFLTRCYTAGRVIMGSSGASTATSPRDTLPVVARPELSIPWR